MKIAYAGFDLFYPAMQALHDCGCEFIKVFTCRTDNVTEFNTMVISLAKQWNVPYTVDKITIDDLEMLKAQGCDAFICAGYYYRVPICEGLPMVNIHPALLPVGRGAWPMPVTILRQLPVSGVTFHKMEESFDTGDILLQRAFEVAPSENLDTFMQKIYDRLPEMIRELTADFRALYDHAVPQSDGEYWECPTEPDWTVDSTMDAEQADRILRAFYGFECIYVDGDRTYELIGGRLIAGNGEDKEFPVKGGYIVADKIRKLNES